MKKAAKKESLRKILESFSACDEAVEWADERPLEEAWKKCKRGDWLLWIAAKVGVNRNIIVLAACACARLSLHFVPKGELRPLKAIEAAERWANGDAGVTLADVITAGNAAYAAACAAYAAAYAAARAAGNAAGAAGNAAGAAGNAAYAAGNAAGNAAYAAGNAAYEREKMLAKCANLVRKKIPWRTVYSAYRKGVKK